MPPTHGPMIIENGATAPRAALYRARLSGGAMSATTASSVVSAMPAPSPWTPRATTSSPMAWLSPAHAEPAKNTTSATRRSRLRPNMSPSRPARTVPTAIVRR